MSVRDKNVCFNEWLGRTKTAPTDIVTQRLVANFAATFGDAVPNVNEVPVGAHWCLAPDAASVEELAIDGHPAKGDFLPPIPLPRRMWASGEISFLSPLLIGDRIEKTSQIKSIEWKVGKSGRLCFVTVAHEYAADRGTLIREDQNIVYREASAGPVLQVEPGFCSEEFDHQSEVQIDNVQLFRYSALTFNAHRIHYDLHYTRDVEFYPDLVIHGPLQATLLLNFAVKIQGHTPKNFKYRGVAPAFGAQSLRLGCREGPGSALSLAIISENGSKTMSAMASW